MNIHYKFKAITKTGQVVKGEFSGTKSGLTKHLQEKGLASGYSEIDILNTIKFNWTLSQPINDYQLSQFFKHLQNFYKYGLPINESLIVLKENVSCKKLKQAIDTMTEAVKAGHSLTDAFILSKVFSQLVVTNIQTGEKAGKLVDVLESLKEYYEFMHKVKKQIKEALIQPIFLLFMIIVVIYFAAVKLIPKMVQTFSTDSTDTIGINLILNFSDFISQYPGTLLLVPGIAIFCLKYIFDKHSYEVTVFSLKVPILKDIVQAFIYTECFLKLYIFQKAGTPINSALDSLKTFGTKFIKEKFGKTKEFMNVGQSLSQAMANDSFFSSFVVSTIKIGETQGDIKESLKTIYDYYSNEYLYPKIQAILTMMPKVMIAICGFIILLLGLTLLTPIQDFTRELSNSIL